MIRFGNNLRYNVDHLVKDNTDVNLRYNVHENVDNNVWSNVWSKIIVNIDRKGIRWLHNLVL
jgi:hypothetical protein